MLGGGGVLIQEEQLFDIMAKGVGIDLGRGLIKV